jgi:CpeT protein
MKKLIYFPFLFLMVFSSFGQTRKVSSKDLLTLRNLMAGTFNSEKQSLEDAEFFHISLIMQPIWEEEQDGYWMYVEQAMANSLDAPYRQRVYHLYQLDEYTLVSQVYEIREQEKFSEKTQQPNFSQLITKDHLIAKEGCGIYLSKTGKARFEGKTKEKDCPSTLRGASYTTSSAILTKNGMTSWDQGWNAEGEQVWGAMKGGYRFDKISGR